MTLKNEILTIEYTLKTIFRKDKITRIDVAIANNLFYKWKKLTEYVEDDKSPIMESILDEEPN
jgi:hypothetical protein